MALDDQGGATADTTDPKTTPAADQAAGAVQDPGKAAGGDQGDAGARTLAGGGGQADDAGGTKVEPAWRDDWREKLAGGDEGFLKQLRRYTSPENYAKAGYEAQQRLRAGAAKAPLPENATPEQLTAWRKDNGIPEKPEAYEIKPDGGLVFSEADKPMLEGFAKFAHERNWTPKQVNEGATFVAQLQEQEAARREQEDGAFKKEAEDQLREEWGGDFRRNLGAISNLFAGNAPDGLMESFLGGRLADGKRIGDSPGVLNFLAKLAREVNPLSTVVPPGTADAGKAVEAELAELRKMMKDDSSDYWRGPVASSLQARYRELLAAGEKVRARA